MRLLGCALVAILALATPSRAQQKSSGALTPNIESILRNIRAADKGQLAVSEEDGRFLRVLVAARGAKSILEIGGASGYSGIWLGLGARESGGKVVTIEYDPQRAKEASENITRAGLTDVVRVVHGDAFKEIPKLQGTFDFVFLDAWKPDYQKFCWMTKLYPYLYSTYGKAINVTIHVRDAETTDGMKRYFFKVEGITVKVDKDSNAEKVLSEIKGQSNDLCLLYHPTFSDYPLPWVRDVLPLISYSRDVTYDADNGGVYVKLDEFLYQHQYTVLVRQIEKQLRYAFIQGWIKTTDEKFIKNNFLILINNGCFIGVKECLFSKKRL